MKRNNEGDFAPKRINMAGKFLSVKLWGPPDRACLATSLPYAIGREYPAGDLGKLSLPFVIIGQENVGETLELALYK